MKKRIFIGSFVNIPDFRKKYTRIKKEFGGVIGGRWIPEENFHITFKFIGDISDNQINLIKQSLSAELDKDIQVSLQFKGLNAFPNIYNPRVFFINVYDSTGVLEQMNQSINRKLSYLGFPADNKPFKPHITLKRIKSVKKELFIERIKEFENALFGEQKSIQINIIESILRPEGALYKKVE
ncbi:2'-5' RNA ligase [Persephonella hydrogeniphila]|uniref:RNA 2',3'-cyclic phosphodiesterase n=1 Tax=Persephonella hydrogeniphila TaxID=198703 RepID=A0A285N501_9AQUI|nr:RNA 2',3'-cyclic phosphodiesterase [Persephonella hydrogeniphila]SNZ02801.1 2'-5' RNA ligase [Persephonella hydrogeniphila]